MIDRYPAAILRCESNADVAAGIRFAREAGLAILRALRRPQRRRLRDL